jgi:hypothetical protein
MAVYPALLFRRTMLVVSLMLVFVDVEGRRLPDEERR